MASKITLKSSEANHNTIDCLELINTQKDFLDDISVDLAKLEALITVALKCETPNLSEAILHEYFFILDIFIKSADKQIRASLDYLNRLSKYGYSGALSDRTTSDNVDQNINSRYL